MPRSVARCALLATLALYVGTGCASRPAPDCVVTLAEARARAVPPAASPGLIDEEERERLRALGYVH